MFLEERIKSNCNLEIFWAGTAIGVIHLTTSFTSMLFEHRVPPLKLLEVMPKLYKELKSYKKP